MQLDTVYWYRVMNLAYTMGYIPGT